MKDNDLVIFNVSNSKNIIYRTSTFVIIYWVGICNDNFKIF